MACGPTRFSQLNGMDLSKTLGRRLINTVDRLRDIPVRFGLRPYEVHVIRTRWTGGERGVGYPSRRHGSRVVLHRQMRRSEWIVCIGVHEVVGSLRAERLQRMRYRQRPGLCKPYRSERPAKGSHRLACYRIARRSGWWLDRQLRRSTRANSGSPCRPTGLRCNQSWLGWSWASEGTLARSNLPSDRREVADSIQFGFYQVS